MKKILVIGSMGQIGTDLVVKLQELYGFNNVIASGRRPKEDLKIDALYEIVDVTYDKRIYEISKKHNIDTVINLAAVLSAVGEEKPMLLWKINLNGVVNTLEVARELGQKVFTPSSIAAFGPSTPLDNTPQVTIQRPTTIYGVSKVAGELICDYYFHKYGVDTRGVRFPGLISYNQLPGGGTTDYAVHIYYEALKNKKYTSYIDKGTFMDMMYMPDAVDSIINLLEADPSKLIDRNAFNVTSMSVDPIMIANSIKKYIPEFEIDFDVDPVRQAIAESWPNSIDSTAAKEQWGFSPKYDLDKMTKDMLGNIKI